MRLLIVLLVLPILLGCKGEKLVFYSEDSEGKIHGWIVSDRNIITNSSDVVLMGSDL